MKRGIHWFFNGLALAALALSSGCDLDSSDDVVRNVGVDYTGQYSNGGAPIISRNTGENITSLNLRQNGSGLEAVDNHGIVFRGSISQVIDGEANFTLKGRTTAGAEGTISGILRANGTSGTISGTWVESTVFGDVTATGSIRGTIDAAPGDGGTNPPDPGNGITTLSLSPSGTVSIATGASQTFTATGGSGSYSWAIGNSGIGSVNRTSGTSVTYTASAAGTQTLSVNDGSTTRAASISQN